MFQDALVVVAFLRHSFGTPLTKSNSVPITTTAEVDHASFNLYLKIGALKPRIS